MRLTVGPLPAAVYWRRRAVVLVGLAMIVLVISYACGGPDQSAGAGQAGSSSSLGTSGGASPSASTTLLHPQVPSTSASASASPKASAFTLPVPVTTGPCTDAEMEVTASAAAAEIARATAVDVSIKIRNISNRTCNRDIGADMQELRINSNTTTIWSSDDCSPNHGHDDRPFTPGQEVLFTLTWTGQQSRSGDGSVVCYGPNPPAATYQLVARLDQKLSAPFTLRISAPS